MKKYPILWRFNSKYLVNNTNSPQINAPNSEN